VQKYSHVHEIYIGMHEQGELETDIKLSNDRPLERPIASHDTDRKDRALSPKLPLRKRQFVNPSKLTYMMS